MDRVIKGRILAPGAPPRAGWIAVEGGRIAGIGTGTAPAATQTDDHGDSLILPGVIDGQTHATSYRGLDGIAETTRGLSPEV
jgi:allantoinase